MTTRLTAPIWRITPGLSFLFYPWRWLVVESLGVSFVAAVSIRALKRDSKWRFLKLAVFVLAVTFNLAIGALMIWRAPHDATGLEEGLMRRDTREYRPQWWDGQLREEFWRTPAHVDSGDSDVVMLDDVGIKRSYIVTAATESVITLRPLYFPGWIARVDDTQAAIRPTAEGNIQLTVEPGRHNLTLAFEDTPPRTWGKVVSALSCVVLISMLYLGRRGKKFVP
jgi:uncharacterized membrane protein YfhO